MTNFLLVCLFILTPLLAFALYEWRKKTPHSRAISIMEGIMLLWIAVALCMIQDGGCFRRGMSSFLNLLATAIYVFAVLYIAIIILSYWLHAIKDAYKKDLPVFFVKLVVWFIVFSFIVYFWGFDGLWRLGYIMASSFISVLQYQPY